MKRADNLSRVPVSCRSVVLRIKEAVNAARRTVPLPFPRGEALEKAADPAVHDGMGRALQYLSEHKGDPAIVALAERVDLDLGKALWPIEKGSQ